MGSENYRYAAFISYRHEPVSRKWAMWLHRAIEGYRVPSSLVKSGKAPRRVGRVFRDEEELAASSDLSAEIDKALTDSAYLIVICTPETPKSRWVNAEIERFRAMGRGDKILALLVEGDPSTSFPPALLALNEYNEPEASAPGTSLTTPPVAHARGSSGPIEPLAADVRDLHNDGKGHVQSQAKLRLIATILGLSFDDLRNREQRRRQARALSTAVVAIAIAAGFAGLSVYALGQRTIARQQSAEAARQRDEAETQRAAAEQRRKESETVIEFITKDVFARATPERMPDSNVRDQIVSKMLDPAMKVVRVKFKDQPLVKATLLNLNGITLYSVGRSAEAAPLHREALDLRRRLLGEKHPDTMASLHNLAEALRFLGRFDEAEPLIRDALNCRRSVLGDDHPDTIASVNELAYVLLLSGRLAEAEPLHRDALDRRRRVLGEEHPETMASVNNLANLLEARGRSAEAEPLYRDSLDRRRRALGEDHPSTISSFYNLAMLLNSLGRSPEAEPLLRAALGRRRYVLGVEHPATIPTINSYAGTLEKLNRFTEAELVIRLAISKAKQIFNPGPNDPTMRAFATRHARILDSLSRPAEAAAVRLEFRLPDPSTQPTTASSTQPTTKPVLIGPLDDDIGRFAKKVVEEWDNDAAWAAPSTQPATGPATTTSQNR